jgi:hypothetical protein
VAGRDVQPVSPEELVESLDRHFLLCYILSVSQRREHGMTGTCPECRERAADQAERERRNAEYERYAYKPGPGVRL